MATWPAVKQYLLSNYRCQSFMEDGLKITFSLDEGRSQVVTVEPAGVDRLNPEWMDINSPIGDLDKVDLKRALRRVPDFVVGGLSARGDLVTLRASLPLENLDRNEIEEPLRKILLIADHLEKELTQADVY